MNSHKEKVLSILNACVEELSSAVQSAVATKLKLLDDDWSQSDLEIRKLLIELTKRKICLIHFKILCLFDLFQI